MRAKNQKINQSKWRQERLAETKGDPSSQQQWRRRRFISTNLGTVAGSIDSFIDNVALAGQNKTHTQANQCERRSRGTIWGFQYASMLHAIKRWWIRGRRIGLHSLLSAVLLPLSMCHPLCRASVAMATQPSNLFQLRAYSFHFIRYFQATKSLDRRLGCSTGFFFLFFLFCWFIASPPPTLKFPCPFLALIHSYSLNPDWTHVGVAHVIASVETDAADAGRRPNVVEPVEAVRVVSFSAISSHPPDPPRFPPPQPLPAIMTNEYNRILSYYYSNPITEQLRQQQQQHKRRSRRRKNNKCKKQIIIELGRI